MKIFGDIGLDILGHALKKGRLPSLKTVDLSGNNTSVKMMEYFLDQFSQELFVITEKAYDKSKGKAIFKDSSGNLHDISIKSDGEEAFLELDDSISGVSAGDWVSDSFKEHVRSCAGGAASGVVVGVGACSGSVLKSPATMFCVAKSAYYGCVAAVAHRIL